MQRKPPADATKTATGSVPVSWPSFARAFLRFAGAYWSGEERWRVRGLSVALLLLTVGQVTIPLAINLWSRRLFDALEQHAMGEFLALIGVLGLVVAYNAAVVTLHLQTKRRLQAGWRAWITRRMLDEWMRDGRHYQVRFAPGEHDNPDGRIAEDIRIATEYAIDLAHSLTYCGLLLASFTQVLWTLSGSLRVAIGSFVFHLPGHLVWVALAYAGVGTVAGLLLGRPLVRAADWRQTQEANFRFGLVQVRETALAIALRRGEGEERGRLWTLFGEALRAWDRQTLALRNLFMFSASWSVMSQAFPFLVAAPRYMAGSITLGGLMQTAQAFQQVIAALAWPIDNVPRLAEWRASVERVLALHEALSHLPDGAADAGRASISVATTAAPTLTVRDLTIAQADGGVLLDHFSTEIQPGERVHLAGDPATTMALVEAVGRARPWGGGRVELPEGASIFFMPPRPDLPAGALRHAIAGPPLAMPADDEAFRAALGRVGLAHLVPRLDETGAWERTLSADEQQRIGFARLLLHRPRWIFIHNAIDALDPPGKAQMLALLRTEFPDATVVSIGDDGVLTDFCGRRLVVPPVDICAPS